MMVWLLRFSAQLPKVFISSTWCLSLSGPSCHQLPNFDLCQSLFYLKQLYDLREWFRWFLKAIFFLLTGPCCATLEYYLFFALPLIMHSTWLEAQQIDHPAMCNPKFKSVSSRNRIRWTYIVNKMAVDEIVIDEPCRPKPYGLSWGYMVAAKLFIGNAEFVGIAMYSLGS